MQRNYGNYCLAAENEKPSFEMSPLGSSRGYRTSNIALRIWVIFSRKMENIWVKYPSRDRITSTWGIGFIYVRACVYIIYTMYLDDVLG